MNEAVIIQYDDAEILASSGRNIIVVEPRSNMPSRFDDKWYLDGIFRDRHDILDKFGEDGIDDEYVFIWIK